MCGLSGDIFKIKDSITNSIFSCIEPHIIPSIDLDTIEDKTILIVNVPSGWDRPYHLKAEGEFDGVQDCLTEIAVLKKVDIVFKQDKI